VGDGTMSLGRTLLVPSGRPAKLHVDTLPMDAGVSLPTRPA
jgi:hypothetical protein